MTVFHCFLLLSQTLVLMSRFYFLERNRWSLFCILRKSFFWEGEDVELCQTVIIIKQNKMMMDSHMIKNCHVTGLSRCCLISRAFKKKQLMQISALLQWKLKCFSKLPWKWTRYKIYRKYICILNNLQNFWFTPYNLSRYSRERF